MDVILLESLPRQIVLEDHDIVILLRVLAVTGPGDLHSAHGLRKADRQGLGADLIGDKLGPGQPVEHGAAQHLPDHVLERSGNAGDLVVLLRRISELAAEHVRRVEAEPGDNPGLEALHAGLAVVFPQDFQGLPAQFLIARAVLELHDDGLSAVHGSQHLCKKRDLLVRPRQPQFPELLEGQVVDAGVHAAHSLQRIVMKDNDFAVLRELHIEFHPISIFNGFLKGRNRILRNALVQAEKTAVSHVPAPEDSLLLFVGAARREEEDRNADQACGMDQGFDFAVVGHFSIPF